MNVLFICSANKDRSPTAEEWVAAHYPQHTYLSAETNQKICFQLGTQYVDEELIRWADLILVMENKHKKELLQWFGSKIGQKVQAMGIKDYYSFQEARLKELLKEKLGDWL